MFFNTKSTGLILTWAEKVKHVKRVFACKGTKQQLKGQFYALKQHYVEIGIVCDLVPPTVSWVLHHCGKKQIPGL